MRPCYQCALRNHSLPADNRVAPVQDKDMHTSFLPWLQHDSITVAFGAVVNRSFLSLQLVVATAVRTIANRTILKKIHRSYLPRLHSISYHPPSTDSSRTCLAVHPSVVPSLDYQNVAPSQLESYSRTCCLIIAPSVASMLGRACFFHGPLIAPSPDYLAGHTFLGHSASRTFPKT